MMVKERISWSLLLQIFWTFCKLGPVTFGGGYAMVPLIEREVLHKRQWLQEHELSDILALAESVPGAIALNTSTFVGHRLARIPGAIAALLGVLLPTFLIVLLFSITYMQLQDHPKIEAAFQAIKGTVVALIVYAGIKMGRFALFDFSTWCVMLGTVAFLVITRMNPILVIGSGALMGILCIQVKQWLGLAVRYEKRPVTETGLAVNYRYGDGI